jgi:hypothetical protein
MIYFMQVVGFLIGTWDETKGFFVSCGENFFVAAGSGSVTTMRIGIRDHYSDPDPGELDQCGSGSETAGSVKTIIRKVRYHKGT